MPTPHLGRKKQNSEGPLCTLYVHVNVWNNINFRAKLLAENKSEGSKTTNNFSGRSEQSLGKYDVLYIVCQTRATCTELSPAQTLADPRSSLSSSGSSLIGSIAGGLTFQWTLSSNIWSALSLTGSNASRRTINPVMMPPEEQQNCTQNVFLSTNTDLLYKKWLWPRFENKLPWKFDIIAFACWPD